MSQKSSQPLEMPLSTGRLVLAGSLIAAVCCVICSRHFGVLNTVSATTYFLTLSGVLMTSFGQQQTQTSRTTRAYVIVDMLVLAITLVVVIDYEYGTHRSWNSFPLMACPLMVAILVYVLHRVMLNFGLTIMHDCIDVIRGRHPSKETRED
jgi:phosphatidylserine synthase